MDPFPHSGPVRLQGSRYLDVLRRRWWLLILTLSLGLCGAAWYVSQQPPAFLSVGRLMVSGQIRINEGAQYTEELFNFFGTQIELMQAVRCASVLTRRPGAAPRAAVRRGKN